MTEKEMTSLLPSLEKQLLHELFTVGEIRYFSAGDIIIKTGQNIRSGIIVLSGLVKIYRQDEEGNDYFVYYLEAGKACAISLVCALGIETSGLMGKAVTDSTILSIPLRYIDEWMTKYKSWTQFIIGTYRERFEELLTTIDHIAFRNMDERLVFYLKRHQENAKSSIISTSFTEIAQDLNSSREVISRLMRKLSDKRMVTLHKSFVEIINLDKALT